MRTEYESDDCEGSDIEQVAIDVWDVMLIDDDEIEVDDDELADEEQGALDEPLIEIIEEFDEQDNLVTSIMLIVEVVDDEVDDI